MSEKDPQAGDSAPEDDKAEASDTSEPKTDAKKTPEKDTGAQSEKPAGEVLIEADGLSKYYGSFTAIENVSFEVRRGQVVAFLGPNGAGKSTTMRLLTGVLAPDRGEARIGGQSVIHNRLEISRRLGYLPENGPLYDEMTPRELLNFLGEARGLTPERRERRIAELSKRLGLDTVINKPVHKLSKGYRQRVGLAQALLHEPDVLIMDEPTTGLDPNQIRDVRRIIREFGENKAILLSTHILQEVEAVADRVVFINAGRVVFQGSVAELRSSAEDDLEAAFATHTGYSASSWATT